MWLSNPINPSKYKIIRRFDLIVAIAKVMRGCHFYYVDSNRHAIYGIAETGSSIREVIIPQSIEVSSSFIFRLDGIDKDILSTYVDFVILDDLPWAMFPLIKRDEFINYYPLFKPTTVGGSVWTVINLHNRLEVEFLDLYGVDSPKSVYLRQVISLVESFIASRCMLSSSIIFDNMDRDLTVRKVFSSKASMGEEYLSLKFEEKSYGMFIFKNLFTLNKSDKLRIYISDRIDVPNVFEACFQVTHSNNPIKFIIPGVFVENTYGTFLRIE